MTDIQPATMARIVQAFPDKFIGVKDATGALARVTEQRAGCGRDFIQLSGNDETALAFNAMGGTGCISVTANVAPRLCAAFQSAWAAGTMPARSNCTIGSIPSTSRCSPMPRQGR